VFVTPSGEWVVKLELSHLRSDDLDISVYGQELRITGLRRDTGELDAYELLASEIPWGRFESRIDVPAEFDIKAAKARYLNGILSIRIPSRRCGTPPSPSRWQQ